MKTLMCAVSVSLLTILITIPIKAQWVQNEGLFGGYISDFLVDNSNIYVAAGGSGIFHTTDNGSTWIQLINGLPNMEINSLAGTGSYLFAGTQPGGSNNCVQRSTDGGQNWEPTGAAVEYPVYDMILEDSTLYVVTDYDLPGEGGVFMSTDYGDSWTDITSDLPVGDVLTITASGNSIFVGTIEDGVYKTTDTGSSWIPVNTGLPAYYSINVLAESGSDLFAGTQEGLYISTDSGGEWARLDSGFTDPFVLSLVISGGNIYAGTYDGIYYSPDYGSSWTEMNTGLFNRIITSLVLAGTDLYGGTDGAGVFRSSNNTDWVWKSNGITAGDISAHVISGNNYFVGTGKGGVFLSTDNGTTWNYKGLGNETVFTMAAGPDGAGGFNIYAGTQTDGVFRSTDFGDTWTMINNGLPDSYIRGMVSVENGTGSTTLYLAAYHNGVFISTDNGDTWDSTGLSGSYLRLFSIVVDGTTLFVSSAEDGVYRSTDGGISWTLVNSGLTSTSVFSLYKKDSNLFAGTDHGIFLSTDNGNSWELRNTGMPEYSWVGKFISVNNMLIAGTITWDGIYRSTDDGEHWQEINGGLINTSINDFAVFNEYVYAGTYYGGLWMSPVSVVTGIDEPTGSSPAEFLLEQNYPNPFNPTTSINYILDKDGYVSLKVYNSLGQQVAELVRGFEKSGNHKVVFNGSGLSSGIYYYRIESGSNISVKKMVLLK